MIERNLMIERSRSIIVFPIRSAATERLRSVS
jgi:hypothetical protein